MSIDKHYYQTNFYTSKKFHNFLNLTIIHKYVKFSPKCTREVSSSIQKKSLNTHKENHGVYPYLVQLATEH